LNNKEIFQGEIRQLGIKEGDTILLHTSIKGLNASDISAEDIIEGLLGVIGEGGTLLVPALSYVTVTTDKPIFDIETTKTCIGTLPEIFRVKYATHRSVHPTHSVCAVGRFAKSLTLSHKLDNTPVGEHSPFRLIPQVEGKILMLGCGLKPNTFMHGIEEIASASYVLAKQAVTYTLTANNITYHKAYYPHNFTNLVQRYDRLSQILTGEELVEGVVLGGRAFLIDAVATKNKAARAILENDMFFVDKIN